LWLTHGIAFFATKNLEFDKNLSKVLDFGVVHFPPASHLFIVQTRIGSVQVVRIYIGITSTTIQALPLPDKLQEILYGCRVTTSYKSNYSLYIGLLGDYAL
jgi:hypothetical protein